MEPPHRRLLFNAQPLPPPENEERHIEEAGYEKTGRHNHTPAKKESNEDLTHLSRNNKNEKAIWQRRYWEHLIRDDEDFTKHVDYIHYNPVKHGLVAAPKEWDYSSLHSYVRKGIYEPEIGAE